MKAKAKRAPAVRAHATVPSPLSCCHTVTVVATGTYTTGADITAIAAFCREPDVGMPKGEVQHQTGAIFGAAAVGCRVNKAIVEDQELALLPAAAFPCDGERET